MPTVTCLVLADPGGFVLATRRPPDKVLGGLWEFPGGKTESGESAEEALRREIREELFLELGALEPLSPMEHSYDFGSIRLLPFPTRCPERPAFHLVEHMESRWRVPGDFGTLAWAPADVPILREIRILLRAV